MSVVSLTSRFANVQFANVLRRFANVFSRFANVVKLLKCIELTIYQICLKIFNLVVDKRTKNNLYAYDRCKLKILQFYSSVFTYYLKCLLIFLLYSIAIF